MAKATFKRLFVLIGCAALLILLTGLTTASALPEVIKESFDYEEGDLSGMGDASGGWAGPWEDVSPGFITVIHEALDFATIPTSGKFIEVSEGGTTFRDLAETWPDEGGTYWISQLYQRVDDIDVNDSYNGFSLFDGGSELLYIGKPWASKSMGLDGSGVESDTSDVNAYDGGWMVVKLVMSGDAENDDAYLWIDPDPGEEPDTASAEAHVQWRGSNGFNRVRIGSGNVPDQAESYYGEITFSQTYDGLTGGGGPYPPPLIYYDFEEEEGIQIIDGGSAGVNGEITGDLIDRVDGGIFSKEGDGTKCLEWVEQNATGELCYVWVPYQEFLNSPNYTLSTWMMYTGEATWGYLFWADGEVWEPEVMDRHIDVWLNPNNRGVDCIMNTEEEGADLRVASLAEESGVDVYDGDWHLVTVTMQENELFTIYLDGVWAVDGISEIPVIENEGDDMWIGARPNNPDATTAVKIVGLMDRVRIWDTVLTEEQITAIYDSEGPDGGTTAVEKPKTENAVQSFALLPNYPNPFNPTTAISYVLDISEQSRLEIFDVMGHRVKGLVNGVQGAGQHTVIWNGTDDRGQLVPSGVYFYRLTGASRTEVRKMMLLK